MAKNKDPCKECRLVWGSFENLNFGFTVMEPRSINSNGKGRSPIPCLSIVGGYIPPSLDRCPRTCIKLHDNPFSIYETGWSIFDKIELRQQ